MIGLLAQAAAPATGSNQWVIYVLVTALVGVTTGGTAMVRQARKSGKAVNGTYNKALCDERHKHLDEDVKEIKKEVRDGFKGVHSRLDAMRDNGPPRVQT